MIYIAGKITGTTDFMERFDAAQKDLEAEGNTVINPARELEHLPGNMPTTFYLQFCFPLLDKCDTVFLLDGWETSPGSLYEKCYAIEMGKDVIFQKDWREEHERARIKP